MLNLIKKCICACICLSPISSFAQIPSYIDTTGLLGWYPFSGNANNAYLPARNGTVMGPVLTTDRFGTANSAYHFDGIWDHIVIDTAFFNIGWSSYTVSYWLNADSVDNPNNFNNSQVQFNTIPHNGLGMGYNWGHSGKYSLYLNSDPSVATWDILASNTPHDVSSHVWNHVVVTKRNDTAYTYYLNGVADTNFHTTLPANNYYCRIFFGNIDSSRGDEGFWGKLDDYAIWRRTLEACEVRKMFHSAAFLYITAHPTDVSTMPGATVHFTVSDTGTGNTYQWQLNSGTGFASLSGSSPYSGVTTPTLTVTGVATTMNNYKYRCVVTGSGPCSDSSNFGKLIVNTLGVQPSGNMPAITVTPNPTTGEVFVSGIAQADIQVYNAVGQLIAAVSKASSIDISKQPAGTYLVRLYSNGRLLHTGKVMKQ